MSQEVFDWLLLIGRWVHITTAVTWVGTSIFFMWLDRSFVRNPESKRPGHIGDLWMVHGGGFYHVEKLEMGPTKVPSELHWFKWESYWTWLSGFFLVCLIFYTGNGTFLLDDAVSDIGYYTGVGIGLFSILGSWFFYDFLWERKITREKPIVGHLLTIAWLIGMTYFLTHTISGRAAYLHIGAMLGTWMTANVFMRIIPRQVKMVHATKEGLPINKDWSKNAKNRSTHNTYFTLPVIFIMLSNHFPATYGHDYNWVILLLICISGAAIREFFIVRLSNPTRAWRCAILGSAIILFVIQFSKMDFSNESEALEMVKPTHSHQHKINETNPQKVNKPKVVAQRFNLKGKVLFSGKVPQGKKLRLPRACASQFKGDVYTNEVMVESGGLLNVVVRVKSGHDMSQVPAARVNEVEVDQKGCIYSPRVIAAQVGQKVTFINSDPIFHNVKSVTKRNQKFNLAMPRKNQRITKTFKREEITLQTKCSVHPWMGAYVAVVNHPYFDVTRKNGEFEIKGLPAGDYVIETWHELYGKLEQSVSVSADTSLEFNYKK